jgi:integrase
MSADAEIDASFRNTVLSAHDARTTRTLMVAAFGIAAKFQFAVHPHMLRHACGYKLANQGVDTRSLQHYLALRPDETNHRRTKPAARRCWPQCGAPHHKGNAGE